MSSPERGERRRTVGDQLRRCKNCGAAMHVDHRHRHERPGWQPTYDDLEGCLEGYETVDAALLKQAEG